MKQLAVIVAAVLSLALVAPALAQPFADVPTDHWAYDAIAELAAKGLIEGYPDGAFRGDRAMTRYEMAMVVARLLARIEAIKIPPLPPDLVRQPDLAKAQAANAAAIKALDQRLTAKLATIQRLVAEFRAELAALGVRVTAVEEELAAIRARLDNTRITGDFRARYNVFPSGSVSGAGTFRAPDARIRMRVTFTGTVPGSNATGVLRVWAANNINSNTYDVRFGSNGYSALTFDLAYVDVRQTWGAQLWRVGRQFQSVTPYIGGGLLYDPANSLGAMTPFTQPFRAGLSDGIRSDWMLGPLNITLAVYRQNECLAGAAPCTGVPGGGLGGAPIRDYRVIRATTGALLPGWTLGGQFLQEWQHPTAPVNTSGGTGYGLDISGTLIPGISIFADWVTWQSIPTVGAASLASVSAWRVGGNLDLGRVMGITMWGANLDFAYENYGGNPNPAGTPGFWAPPTQTYGTTFTGQYHTWDMRGFYGRLNLTFSPRTGAWILYQGGTRISSGQNYNEWWLRFTHRVATNTTVTLNYFKNACGTTGGVGCPGFGAGGDIDHFYRAELLYNW